MAVSAKKIIEALENNEAGLTQTEIAMKLGITQSGLSHRLKKLRGQIKDKSKEYINNRALDYARHLHLQSEKGKTEATKLALEIAGIYTHKTQIDVNQTIEDKLKAIDEKAREAALKVQERDSIDV